MYQLLYNFENRLTQLLWSTDFLNRFFFRFSIIIGFGHKFSETGSNVLQFLLNMEWIMVNRREYSKKNYDNFRA